MTSIKTAVEWPTDATPRGLHKLAHEIQETARRLALHVSPAQADQFVSLALLVPPDHEAACRPLMVIHVAGALTDEVLATLRRELDERDRRWAHARDNEWRQAN